MDVGRNLALKSLYCESNELSSLDVGGCPALKVLGCSYNAWNPVTGQAGMFLSGMPDAQDMDISNVF